MSRTGRPRGSGVVPIEVRFWDKVDRRDWHECWPWLKAVSPGGYGVFGVNPGELGLGGTRARNCSAHRVAFYLVHGRWPEPWGLHGCDNPGCCNAENPVHVHEGTPADNVREMWERGRAVAPPVLMGSEANRAKLTDSQARELISRYEAGGVSQQSLAEEFGVSQPSVSRTIRGLRRSLQ